MGTVGRGIKSNGTTSLADGNTIFASELNTDFDTLYTLVNGQVDNDNVSASAAIAATKLDDYSSTATDMRTQTSPGTSDNESLATTMAGELERLRYALWQIKVGTTAARNDGSAKGLYWGDEPVRGQNLCRNSSFEVKSSSTASDAPDGWTAIGPPTSCTLTDTTPGTGVSDGKLVRITSAAGSDGISQSFAGLKPRTLYYISARARVVAGGDILSITTTGGYASGEFRNFTRTVTSTSFAQYAGVVETDATPTAIVLRFVLTAAGDICEIDDVQFREINADIVSRMGYMAVRDTSTGTGALSNADSAFPAGDQLTAAVTVPAPGYWIRVSAVLRYTAGGTTGTFVGLLDETPASTGTATEVDTSASTQADNGELGFVTLSYLNSAPTPGETYTYSTSHICGAASGTANGSANGKTVQSNLLVELIPPG